MELLSTRPLCGEGNQGDVHQLTEEQLKTLVEFAQEHAPALVAKIRTARFYRQKNEQWVALLDQQKHEIGVFVHVSLWEQLFG